MSFSCGTQLSTGCEREGPTAPGVGSLSPIEAFLVCPFSVGSSSQVSVRGRDMSHVATLGGTAKLNCFPCERGVATPTLGGSAKLNCSL